MSENLGTGVSYVNEVEGYNYDTVVFQKGKPPLDSELNLLQDIRRELGNRQLSNLPSGWLTFRPYKTSPLLQNQFYTQDPTAPIPEYANVGGMVVHVTGTGTQQDNLNIVTLPSPPTVLNQVNGAYLEVWRALLGATNDTNRPLSTPVTDSLLDVHAVDTNYVWAVGENGLILTTENGGQTWSIQASGTRNKLNSVFFYSSSIGWAVGDSGIIVRTSSGGVRWTPLTTGLTENLNSVFAMSQQIAWVVGSSGIILKTTNGISWSTMVSGSSADLKSIFFNNNGMTGWCAGTNGTVLKTSDGGINWRKLPTGSVADLNAVYFFDLNYGFAVGKSGTILRSSDGGETWINQSANTYDDSLSPITITTDYTDITMAPDFDVQAVSEQIVQSQIDGTNKIITVMNNPITTGNGKGITTYTPTDVRVAVNSVDVNVVAVNGATGQITLLNAPPIASIVRVTYYYRPTSEIFNGVSLISGKSGVILRTVNIGQQWVKRATETSYDLNALSFVDKNIGWALGQFSTIQYSVDSGTTWTTQTSSVLSRQVRRVYNEGNIGTMTYLSDNIIHPDANIETTKRVQIQYAIRVADNVDPFNYPDAGLGAQDIYGIGPNTGTTTTLFSYENMGNVTGDFGLYRARCSNTVDGFCWAIPMAFINRRNSGDYNTASNTNGQYNPVVGAIRPDLLTALNVVDNDILDVRRKINIPSTTEILDNAFDALLNNELRTRFARNTDGGDRYGTELLQTDSFDITKFITDGVSSTAKLLSVPTDGSMTDPLPISVPLPVPTDPGYFHPSPMHYSAIYTDSGTSIDGFPIPGYFEGLGTRAVTFYVSPLAATATLYGGLKYKITGDWVTTGSSSTDLTSLTQIPTTPQLVANISSSSNTPLYFRGVFEEETSGRVIEEWDSEISGYPNYAIAFPGTKVTSTPAKKASTVELHYFLTLAIASGTGGIGIDPGNLNRLIIDPTLFRPASSADDSLYVIWTISKVNNITSGFSYKIENTQVGNTQIIIDTVPGYQFIEGIVIEVVGSVISSTVGDIRSGSTANFSAPQKSFGTCCKSEIKTTSITALVAYFTTTNGDILGSSAVETADSLTQAVCWVQEVVGVDYQLYPVMVSRVSNRQITVNFSYDVNLNPGGRAQQFQPGATAKIQLALGLTATADFPNDGSNDTIEASYSYAPSQSVDALPTSLTISMVERPASVCISNMGTGGSLIDAEPYKNPLISIPIADTLIEDDNLYCNLESLRFPNFSVTGGFISLPIYVPGNFGSALTFTGIATDNIGRVYYDTCSKELSLVTEGLLSYEPRKVFSGCLARVTSSSDNKFIVGEYILVVFSRSVFMDSLENWTGYEAGKNCAIAIYRLPNKPISRV